MVCAAAEKAVVVAKQRARRSRKAVADVAPADMAAELALAELARAHDLDSGAPEVLLTPITAVCQRSGCACMLSILS